MSEVKDPLARYSVTGDTIRREAEVMPKAKWKKIFTHPEEFNPHGFSGEPAKPKWQDYIKAGNLSQLDLAAEVVDPELLILKKEYKEYEERALKKNLEVQPFHIWMGTEDEDLKVKPSFKSEKHLELDLSNEERAPKYDIDSIIDLWKDPETEVVYVYRPDKKNEITLNGIVDNKAVQVDLKVEDLKSMIEQFPEFNLPHPGEGYREKFWKVFKSINVNGKPLATDNFRVEYPVSKIQIKLEKLKEKFDIKTFESIKAWFWLWKDRNIQALGLGLDNGSVKEIAIRDNEDNIHTLPFEQFRYACGLLSFEGKPVVLPLKLPIASGVNPLQLRDTLESLEINEVPLEAPVFIVDLEKAQAIGEN